VACRRTLFRRARRPTAGRFLWLTPLPSLFAFVGVRLPWRKHKSFRPHAREGAQRDPFTSVKQLRPLPRHTCAPRASRAPIDGVDGDGEARILGCGPRCRLMKMEKHADGMESRQRLQVRVRRYPSPPSGLGCGFTPGTRTQGRSKRGRAPSFYPPAFTFALALALVPTFAPTLLLVPTLRSCCVVCDAQPSSCAGTRTHSHTRRDGEARLWVRVRVRCEHLLPLIVVLVNPSSCAAGAVHMRYAKNVDIKAGVCVGACICLCVPHSRAPARHRAIEAGCPYVSAPASPSSSYTDMEDAGSADPDMILSLDVHWHVAEAGMENSRGCAVDARTFYLPLPCTRSYFSAQSLSLPFSPNSVRSLFSARFDVRSASHSPSPIHIRTAIALNETGS
jgi:hypothetical protein